MRDIDRLLIRAGSFRMARPHLQRFLDHPDQRVREYAEDLLRPPVREADPEWESECTPDDGYSGGDEVIPF